MRPNEPQAQREFSLGGLFSDLTRELSTLVRQESQLIKAELSEKASDVGVGIGEIATGGAVLLAGLIIFLLAVVAMVTQMLGATAVDYPWLSPLIVGTLVLIVGFVLLQRGRTNLRAGNLVPRKTGESLRRDKEVLKEQFK
jgi:xanthine/uracil permease